MNNPPSDAPGFNVDTIMAEAAAANAAEIAEGRQHELTLADIAETAYRAFEIGVWQYEHSNYAEACRWLAMAVDSDIEQARPLLQICQHHTTVPAADPHITMAEAVEEICLYAQKVQASIASLEAETYRNNYDNYLLSAHSNELAGLYTALCYIHGWDPLSDGEPSGRADRLVRGWPNLPASPSPEAAHENLQPEDSRQLIERSSLGTPAARALRALSSPTDVANILDRADKLKEQDSGKETE